jgi:putative spermidine/putrescine transport system permease protein
MTGAAGRQEATRARTRRFTWTPYLLVAPACLLVGLLLFALAFLFVESLRPAVGKAGPSLLQYTLILGSPQDLSYFWRSGWLALSATAIALVAGFPVAWYLDRAPAGMRTWLMGFLVLTFFSDYVLRMFGLVLVFGRNGIVNQALGLIGIEPLRMMYNHTGVLIGLVASSLPFTILSTAGVLGRIDPSQVAAARLLGASPWRAFVSITLPLCVPGLFSGGVIVFLLSLNSFVVPALLGGGFVDMVASHIYEQGINLFNLPFGAAASFIILLLAMALLAIGNTLFDRHGRRFGVVPAQSR